MSDVNTGTMAVKSEVIIDKEYFLEHTRSIPVSAGTNAKIEFTVGSEDPLEFAIDVNFKKDLSMEGNKIIMNSDQDTGIISVDFINWTAPYYNALDAVSTEKKQIGNYGDKKLYMNFMVYFVKDVKDSAMLIINLYSK